MENNNNPQHKINNMDEQGKKVLQALQNVYSAASLVSLPLKDHNLIKQEAFLIENFIIDKSQIKPVENVTQQN